MGTGAWAYVPIGLNRGPDPEFSPLFLRLTTGLTDLPACSGTCRLIAENGINAAESLIHS